MVGIIQIHQEHFWVKWIVNHSKFDHQMHWIRTFEPAFIRILHWFSHKTVLLFDTNFPWIHPIMLRLIWVYGGYVCSTPSTAFPPPAVRNTISLCMVYGCLSHSNVRRTISLLCHARLASASGRALQIKFIPIFETETEQKPHARFYICYFPLSHTTPLSLTLSLSMHISCHNDIECSSTW